MWASGVTYLRSKEARVEESTVKDVYSKVYEANRPELFFKSPSWRVVGTGERIGIRSDSDLNIPEPELGIVINSFGELFGFAICNDVSSRSIEAENPLYLPQAKMYAGSCALGPGIRPAWEVERPHDLSIYIWVTRQGKEIWHGTTSSKNLKRSFEDLIEYLFRGDFFPDGVILSTGTGIVPEIEFTLEDGDIVKITIDQIGYLTNKVSTRKEDFAQLVHSLTSLEIRGLLR